MRNAAVLVFSSSLAVPFSGALAQEGTARAALEEVVVTAQKRSENLQSVPLAVTAVTGDELRRQGVVDVLALENIAPSVQVSTGALGPQINVRGITSTNSTEVGDPAVAFHVDGVYAGRPRSLSGTFFDVERIEVLRGPQGTLYGRNATAGSVNLVTKKPTQDFEASAAVEAGNYNLLGTSAALNVPVSPEFALRGAFQTYEHDGYTNNAPAEDANDDDIRAGRVHMLWTPADSVSILLSADALRNSRIGGQSRPLPITGDTYTFPIDNTAGNPSNEQRQEGASVTFNWDAAPGTLTYIGAYRADELDSGGPSSTSPVPVAIALEQQQQSHELRLAGENSSLKWLVGAYYYDEEQTVNVALPTGPNTLGFIQDPVKAESIAAFTQETYSITPELRLTAGVRYSKDKKSRLGGVFINGLLISPNIAADEWSKVSYRLAMDWDVTPDSLLYGTVTTGYKAGGYMDGVPPNSYGPENLIAFELGSKNRLADDRLQLNLSAFYYDYEDYQVTYLGRLFPDDANSPIVSRTTNAKQAENYGAEVELLFAATPQDRLNLSGSWLHGRYEDLRLEVTDLYGRNDYSGNKLAGAPEFSVNAGYEHTWMLGAAGNITARAQVQYASEKDLDYRNFALTRQDPYATFNANLIYTTPDERWTVELWGRNLGDEAYLVAAAPNTTDLNTGTGVLGTPRTYGVRLSAQF